MNRYINIFQLIAIIVITLMSFGCPGITPHENFKDALYDMIGQSIDSVPSYSWPREKELIESKQLLNGNIENRYKYYRGNCFYIFEIDSKTRKIVGARFEGSERDCMINP